MRNDNGPIRSDEVGVLHNFRGLLCIDFLPEKMPKEDKMRKHGSNTRLVGAN